MSGKHVSLTPATAALRAARVAFTEHVYEYVDHGGTAESARQLGLDEHAVVKTLVMQDKAMPVFVERSVLALPRIWINGGRRGYLVGIGPAVLVDLLGATPVDCALAD